MNEIRHINLGRQAYTIAADAYKELHDYLEAIRRAAGKEVAEEVELRIAELLAERGVTDDKVILPKDIAYIKEQLGTPTDFSDEASDEEVESQAAGEKRLYRDTDNAMIAGVAAGLGKYFGLDPIIFRIIFVALTFAGASGILIYILLWLLVPEAKTKSDRLKMQGLPINVDTIKDTIERADVEGATRRASRIVAKVLTQIIYVLLAVIGAVLIIGGLAMMLGALALTIYGAIHGLQVGEEVLFPVGSEQVALLICGFTLVALIAILLVASGLALIQRKWRIPGWGVAAIIGLFLAAGSAGAALAADSAPTIKQQYRDLYHSRHVGIQPFQQLDFKGGDSGIYYVTQSGPTADIDIHSLGKVDTSAIKIAEQNGKLTIDASGFRVPEDCGLICPYGRSNVEIMITVPETNPMPVPLSRTTDGTIYSDDPYFRLPHPNYR